MTRIRAITVQIQSTVVNSLTNPLKIETYSGILKIFPTPFTMPVKI